MRLRRIRAGLVAATVCLAAACSLPAEPKPFPPQNEDLELRVDEVTREAERQMEEMMRENQELLDQLGGEDEPLRLTPLGD